jgi:hypothetical protein
MKLGIFKSKPSASYKEITFQHHPSMAFVKTPLLGVNYLTEIFFTKSSKLNGLTGNIINQYIISSSSCRISGCFVNKTIGFSPFH